MFCHGNVQITVLCIGYGKAKLSESLMKYLLGLTPFLSFQSVRILFWKVTNLFLCHDTVFFKTL